MIVRTIFPPDIVDTGDAPVVFLAGPILGAPEWQREAILYITRHAPRCVIACPRTLDAEWHKMYEEQMDWETHYLTRAGRYGVIMFWLARELDHSCERSYAQTTRFELGEWFARSQSTVSAAVEMVVGIERGFPGERYARRKFSQAFPSLTLHGTLSETCKDVVDKVRDL